MGQRYEKSKKNVSENKKTLERLHSDKDTLQNEYAPLSLLDSIQGLLDDEATDAIQGVRAVGEVESHRIESETDTAEEEKKQITGEINSEIAKLNAGLEKLRRSGNIEFGKRAVEQSSQEYKKQIDKFKSLIGELGGHAADGGASGSSGIEGVGGIVSENISDAPVPWSEGETINVPHMEPNRSTPRDLPQTQYGFTKDSNGNLTYDSPMEMDKYLYAQQGSAYTNFQGTCGLCSCANILRLAGVNYSEKDMIDYAASTSSGNGWFQKLCTVNPLSPESSGGTNPKSRQQILEHFGISSGVFPVEMENGVASDTALENIAQYVADGRGVILSVHAGVLYNGRAVRDDYHAVTVTSVTRNKYGDVSGFYICDSNVGTTYYTALQIKEALTGADMNVTHSHIR